VIGTWGYFGFYLRGVEAAIACNNFRPTYP